jgi:hypothetical protein
LTSELSHFPPLCMYYSLNQEIEKVEEREHLPY